MTARMYKEIRELLPLFIGTVLLIAGPYLVWGHQAGMFGLVALVIGCLIMAGATFGNEFLHRTLPLLMSQPVPRSVLWREKMLVLASGMGGSFLVVLAVLALAGWPLKPAEAVFLLMIPLCAFCGTPYFTLQSRNAMVGIVSSLSVPAMVFTTAMLVCHEWLQLDESVGVWITVGLLLVYCPVCYTLGYALFRRLQVQDSAAPVMGTTLGLPAWVETGLLRPLGWASARWTGPWASLVKKECHLQQVTFLLAGIFSVVAVLGGVLAVMGKRDWAGIIAGGDYGIYVILLPLIAGAISVAEERGWGVAEWHLTLPASGARQWTVKMLVALSASLVLGLFLPAGLLVVGVGIPYFEPVLRFAWVILMGHLVVTTTASFTGSFSTSTLRAILVGYALVLAMIGCAVWGLHLAEQFALNVFDAYPRYWPEGVDRAQTKALLQGGLALVPVFGFLQLCGFLNYRRSGHTASRFVIQILGALVLVLALSIAVGTNYFFNVRQPN